VNDFERIAVLETRMEDMMGRLERIESALEMLVSSHQKDEVGREMVYTIGKWTVWIVMGVASVFHAEKIVTWFSHFPLEK
jgi:hypothetical protein